MIITRAASIKTDSKKRDSCIRFSVSGLVVSARVHHLPTAVILWLIVLTASDLAHTHLTGLSQRL